MRDVPFSYEVRALMIVDSFRATSVYPTPVDAVHAVAYFADALASIWSAKPMDEAVLKNRIVPRNAKLQSALDRLVGRGLLLPTRLDYVRIDDESRLLASYWVNNELAGRVLAAMDADGSGWSSQRSLVREVAIAAASLGHDRVPLSVMADASYSDPLLDNNTVVELLPMLGKASRTEDANARLAEAAEVRHGLSLSPAELTTIYLRHLYPYIEVTE